MIGSVKLGYWVAVASMLALVVSCTSGRESTWETTAEPAALDESAKAEVARLMDAAAEAWANRIDQDSAMAAIDGWKAVVAIDPKNWEAWAEMSHGLYYYADCFLRFDEQKAEEHKAMHDEGVKAAERALTAMSPAFAEKMAAGALIEDSVDLLTREAIPALYWRSSNLARWATLESFATLLSYKDEVKAVMEVCLNEWPDYFWAGPVRYFGAYYARLPGFAGGDMTKSKEYFDASFEAYPEYFGTRVLMAEEWAIKEGDRASFEQLLKANLEGDVNAVPEITAENTCDQRKSEELLADIDEYF